jgi:predicted transcriptional regulator
MQTEVLMEKIKGLPPEKIVEVEDFVDFLAQRSARQARQARHDAIAAYAAQHAGTDADLDVELEQAAVEHFFYVRQAIEKGLEDSAQGRTVSVEQVRQQFGLPE